MTVAFREARRADVPAITALLTDDMLGAGREGADPAVYLAAFDAMAAEPSNALIVGVDQGRVAATYQLTFIQGLSRRGARRAVLEAVRVADNQRGAGVGAALVADAEARAREAGCVLIQLTSDKTRTDAHRFYQRLGYQASHLGFKRALDS